ncbi:MAG: energy-coupling factor transporter transmembrane component T family protein [Anaerolineae bacterium]
MGPTFDLYVHRQSWLHCLDPRTKLAFVILVTVLLLSFQHLVFLLACLIIWHGVLLSAQIPPDRLRWVWERMLPLTLLIFLLWPLFDPQGRQVLLQIWRIRIAAESVLRGLATALRVDALAFAFFILLFSTDQAGLVRGLVKLGLPYTWGLTLAIALRYIPTFHGVYINVMEAQQARGWIVGRGDFITRLRSYLPVLVAVIIIALRMTDHLAMALAARGLGAGPQRTTFRDVRFSRKDGLCLVGLAALAGVLFTVRWAYGWGAGPW